MSSCKLYIFTLTAFLLFLNCIHGQEKFEKEIRIKEKDLPAPALQFIQSLNTNGKLKYYKEEGIDRTSYEAKFKMDKSIYSVEFDSLGIIEDVEVEISWNDLSSLQREAILSNLKEDCLSHKIVKIQKQSSGSESDLFSKIKDNKKSENITTHYEIVVRCKQQNSVELYEYLFGELGETVLKSKIIFKSSSHLEY